MEGKEITKESCKVSEGLLVSGVPPVAKEMCGSEIHAEISTDTKNIPAVTQFNRDRNRPGL